MNNASILGLETAVPPDFLSQHEIVEKYINLIALKSEDREKIRATFDNSAIQKRHTVIPDFNKERSEWHFWGQQYPTVEPTIFHRNEVFKREAPKLALEAANKVIKTWGEPASKLTHIISVSCTGMIAPGIEFELMEKLNLNLSISRLGINFMGCFGAFKGLETASLVARNNPSARILLVCTELCSLHLQATMNPHNLLGASLFADGAAAVIIGQSPIASENPLWTIHKNCSLGLKSTKEKMTWEAGETGFLMKLSPQVPVYIHRHIAPFAKDLLGNTLEVENCDWAIHPGGKSIIQAAERALNLEKSQTLASWETLADYGNMSSPTFLFVLENLRRQHNRKKWIAGLGFGPGLSFEGILLSEPD